MSQFRGVTGMEGGVSFAAPDLHVIDYAGYRPIRHGTAMARRQWEALKEMDNVAKG
jgi:hypothetical protein